MTTALFSVGDSREMAAATTCALWLLGSTEALTALHLVCSVGIASASSTAIVAEAMISGRRTTTAARRYQTPLPTGAGLTAPRRAPSKTNSAGRSSSEVAAAVNVTTAPPMPIDCRKLRGKTMALGSALEYSEASISVERPSFETSFASSVLA